MPSKGPTELHPDFGRTAADYREHRAGFPPALLERLQHCGIGRPNQRLLDVGTGTGSMARLMAPEVASVTAIDPSPQMLEAAAELDRAQGVTVKYRIATAEETGEPDGVYDVVTVGQAWAWFDARRAAVELRRVLAPGGRLVIAQLDWLPLRGNLVEATEHLIIAYNSSWDRDGGTGLYPEYLTDLAQAKFTDLETFSFDIGVPYTLAGWVGRIRASAGIAASLELEEVQAFSRELTDLMREHFGTESTKVPHRVWAIIGRAGGPHESVSAGD